VTSGQHLQGLMRDVMDLGRVETGKLAIELRPIDANGCAQAAATAVSALAEQAGVTLSCWPAASASDVCADADRLHQCLVNMLTNAIKYNGSGGWVRIEVTGGSHEVSIAVRDNGIGMDATQRQSLFEPFNRLGRQGSETPGAGLGLVITQGLVEAMNGRLRVDSDAGVGSCFTIVLPGAAVAALS
jgi:signal transduction histidine kinase